MELVLDVYKRAYNEARPVVCMDESPKQLISETRKSIPMSPGFEKNVIMNMQDVESVMCLW